jgi:hypothetical protein
MKQKIPNYCAIDLYYEYVIFTIKYQPAAPSAAFSIAIQKSGYSPGQNHFTILFRHLFKKIAHSN